MAAVPLITVAVPSLNQGRFLEDALRSICNQQLPVEIFVVDGGSTDGTVEVLKKWSHRLAGWRSHQDCGQAAAINEAIAAGSAPYVCWLNSDDWFLPQGLAKMAAALDRHPEAAAVYGNAFNVNDSSGSRKPVWVEPFNARRLALRCIISQPATLIRRSSWEAISGLNVGLQLAMDYDLWWRLYLQCGPLYFLNDFIAVNRDHLAAKTRVMRRNHYREAMAVVNEHYGRIPLKWWLAQPYAIWFKWLRAKLGWI